MKKKNKQLVITPINSAIVIVVALVCIFSLYSITVYRNLKSEVITLLTETAKHTATALENKISGDQHSIQDVALSLSDDEQLGNESTMTILNKIVSNHNYLRMGIFEQNNNTITTDKKITTLKPRPYLLKALNGELSISDPFNDIVDGNPIIVYAAPIFEKDFSTIRAALFATFSISDYHNALAINVFESRGCSFVIKKCGNIISSSCSSLASEDLSNLFDHLRSVDENNNDNVHLLASNVLDNKEGYIQLFDKGKDCLLEKKYFYYAPLKVNNWVLVTSVPENLLNSKMISTLLSTFIFAIIVVMTTAIILIILLNNQKRSKKILESIVYKSNVTGNLSYEKFKLEASKILENMEYNYALITIDIDKFKYINDMFGYAEGDSLIRFIDATLLKNCRHHELTAHVSADDIILLLRYDDIDSLCYRLESINKQIDEYQRPLNTYYKISLAMGVYQISENETDLDAMKDRAGIPMKLVKNKNDKIYAFYDESFRMKILFERDLENRMKNALDNGEFVVYYQPKYSAIDESLCGGEALVRWQQKDGSILSPISFIPLFEDNGFIVQLDKYVFNRLCSDIDEWQKQGFDVVPISCNISRKSVVIENLVDEYEAIIQQYDVDPSLVSLELTESAFIENDYLIREFVEKINSKNFKIVMDDFGIGFSSFGLLKDIDIHTLKLDRSFIQDIAENTKSRAIVETLIKLMKQWNVKVNAEGVETLEQLTCLRNLHCDEIQGYYYDKPLVKEEFEKRMKHIKENV